MSDISRESVEDAIDNVDPVLEALTMMLKELAAETVAALEAIVTLVGSDPSELPGEFLLQAVLIESDKVFQPIDRDEWIRIWDSYHEVAAIIEANPDLKAKIQGNTSNAMDKLLDGNF